MPYSKNRCSVVSDLSCESPKDMPIATGRGNKESVEGGARGGVPWTAFINDTCTRCVVTIARRDLYRDKETETLEHLCNSDERRLCKCP